MAASSTDDVPTQLAALLGKLKVAQIRKTDENPPRISIIDVIATISGKDKNQAAEDLRRISAGHPEVKAICFDFKFPGRSRAGPRLGQAGRRLQASRPGRSEHRALPGCTRLPRREVFETQISNSQTQSSKSEAQPPNLEARSQNFEAQTRNS